MGLICVEKIRSRLGHAWASLRRQSYKLDFFITRFGTWYMEIMSAFKLTMEAAYGT
jgi:hypothetical protein